MQTDNRQRLYTESLESQHQARRFNPASVAKWKSKYGKHEWILAAGECDSIYFFREPKTPYVYCLSVNTGWGYIGLQIFDEKNDGEIGDIFSQNPDEEFSGIMDLLPINQAKTLANYLSELSC